MVYHYYLSANSSRGYIDFTAGRAAGLQHVQRTVGYPSAVMRDLSGAAIELAREQGLRLDIVHQPLDGSVTGLILPERSAAVLNTPYWLDRSRHVDNLLEDEARDEARALLQKTYDAYAAALKIHDEWEKIYISQMDFKVLNEMAEAFAKKVLADGKAGKPGKRTDAVFGASTPEGPVDYIANLTMDLPQRYFMKGRPGTGKSTFLKKVADAAVQAGVDTEVYHCAFDPESLDMLVMRAKGVCIFDSTAPHEYFPTRSGDEIVDIYTAAVRPGTDERYAAQIGVTAKQYKAQTAEGAKLLGEARAITDDMDQRLRECLDSSRTALAMEQILNTLFAPEHE